MNAPLKSCSTPAAQSLAIWFAVSRFNASIMKPTILTKDADQCWPGPGNDDLLQQLLLILRGSTSKGRQTLLTKSKSHRNTLIRFFAECEHRANLTSQGMTLARHKSSHISCAGNRCQCSGQQLAKDNNGCTPPNGKDDQSNHCLNMIDSAKPICVKVPRQCCMPLNLSDPPHINGMVPMIVMSA